MMSASITREGSTNQSFKERILDAARRQRENADVGCANKTSITLDILYDSPGALDNVIQCFRKHSVNMSSIDSKLRSFARDGPVFNIDFDGALSEPKVQTMLMDLRMHCAELQINDPRECDWFPMNIRDLDLTRETLDGGTDLINEDHPGFHDENYRKRREDIVQIAQDYRHGTEITKIDYTENETKTWGVVYVMNSRSHDVPTITNTTNTDTKKSCPWHKSTRAENFWISYVAFERKLSYSLEYTHSIMTRKL